MTPITPQDINKYIATIRINFENAYKTQTDEEREILIKSWYVILKDYPKEIVDKAVINSIKYAKFAPRIGDIVEQIEKLCEAYEKGEEELWAELTGVLREVSRNIGRYSYTFIDANGKTQGDNARQRNEYIFENLSPELKAYCNNISGLYALAQYTAEEIGYEKGRFMRLMPTIKQRVKTRAETSPQLAVLIQGLTSRFTLGCAETKLLQGD